MPKHSYNWYSQDMKNKYSTYRILIAAGQRTKTLDVVAVSVEAAHADILQAYAEVRIVQTSIL